MQTVLVNDRVERIKYDENEINRFVEEYKPFIASCTQKVTGRYVHYGEDDELSIALIAFVEAIKSYDNAKGNFLSFAQWVIKRRLIDYYRKESRHSNVILLSEYYSEEDSEKDLSIEKSIDKYSIDEVSEYRRLELEELKQELEKWDISFFDLVEASPKHNKTRKICANIIYFLISQPDMIRFIKQKKQLPMLDIEKNLKIPRKKIERSRKYIISAILILTGDYQYIRDYIDIEKGLNISD